nr:diguanylate cyclase [uncultured Desulfuromonas sp.]
MIAKCLCFFFIFILSMAPPLCAETEQVSVQLQWLHQFQFAGFYVAEEQGFYHDAGLDVTMKPYTPGLNVVEEVVQRRAEFGTGKSSLILDRLHGNPVVILGAIFQQSPEILITTRPDIKTPADLAGKKIMITQDQANATSLLSMLMSQGVNLNELHLQPHSSRLQDLISGKTDAMASYLSNEPYQLDQLKIPYRVFNPADYGFSSYGDLLFTSEEQITHHPQRTRAFYSATIKGWQWAFDHIEETAQLIYTRYNTQDKTLDSLIYEGMVLKRLAMGVDKKIGQVNREKLNRTLELYRLTGQINGDTDSLDKAIDPFGFNKSELKIGILAHRGDQQALHRWAPLLDYLNATLEDIHTTLVPIPFDDIPQSVRTQSIDCLIVNPILYVQLENQYGLSRIASLLNRQEDNHSATDQYGGVIFTARNNPLNLSPDMFDGKTVAAVNRNSFGGWLMALETFEENNLSVEGIDLKFLSSHDAVVSAVLNGQADIGIIRTGILEHLQHIGRIQPDDFFIVHEQKYRGFPYRVSTKLYPEWSMAKLRHVPIDTANQLASALLGLSRSSEKTNRAIRHGWTVPIDYSSVHTLLKKLRFPPYDEANLDVKQFIQHYALWFYGILAFLTVLILHAIYSNRHNKHLEREVRRRTRALRKANSNLTRLARTDPLTGLNNRRYFMEFAQQYISLAHRNGTDMQLLSLDLDHFKQINDHYGHEVGDKILKLFATTLVPLLRSTDLLARTGGEEFVICLQNTTQEGAQVFARKILETIRELRYRTAHAESVTVTVSIGIASLTDGENLEDVLRRSDHALYQAKENGRDQYVLAAPPVPPTR